MATNRSKYEIKRLAGYMIQDSRYPIEWVESNIYKKIVEKLKEDKVINIKQESHPPYGIKYSYELEIVEREEE